MNYWEFCLKMSKEGREWITLLMPLIMGFVGWHLPPPDYMRKPELKL